MNTNSGSPSAPVDRLVGPLPVPMLTPFVFINPGKWSDGFNEHGIFEIMQIDGNKLTIRRVATARADCAINETRVLWRTMLDDQVKRVGWESFGK